MNIEYMGSLRTHSVHLPSGDTVTTDAPTDNKGKGEAYSPTDLLSSALGSCMLTIMGIKADDLEISIVGTKIIVKKHMSTELPRRVSQLDVNIQIPHEISEKNMQSLEKAALNCPVAKSIHPDLHLNFKMSCA
jgi:putative redox protein